MRFLLLLVCLVSPASTGAAEPSSVFTDHGIGCVEWMSPLAVSSSCFQCSDTFTAKDVFAPRCRFEMRRIDAQAVPAKVVEAQTIRQGAECKQIRNTVGELLSTKVKSAVTSFRTTASPRPTFPIDLRGQGPKLVWRVTSRSIVARWAAKPSTTTTHVMGRSWELNRTILTNTNDGFHARIIPYYATATISRRYSQTC
jgi:hypothetical protein